ncbi:hypothetical protein [Mycolicibacterium monacense]|uniref:Uncharacterized protein n=1 Tax=Mycolicibacterium monacense TaxID=85693 RepID=A0AAD1MWE0_MYCMB|nr:hypothetical protein [Mycolicibacterium monacense]MDA4102652.1 hypothetical protein [Mycolicibacterium monacense DSM 44395]BBZ58764.1 hypothetical protein MMON_00650 [Mycolicibacterium monacense]
MTKQSKPAPDSVNKIFGETLPETSSDERDDRAFEDEAQHDRWLRDNIPPHHG